MIYVYNKKNGLVETENREDALQLLRTKQDTVKETKSQMREVNPYWELTKTYEAILLLIIKRGNELYPDYLTKKKVGEVFTITMMRWYSVMKKSYTLEKPIRVGKIKRYNDNIGFPAFDRYYDNIRKYILTRENERGYVVLFTEIPQETINTLVDDKNMIRTVFRAVSDARFPSDAERIIKLMYKRLPRQYKIKGGNYED